VVNPAALIAANPCIRGQASEFTATGKGGVPSSPNDALSSAASPFPWVEEEGRSKKEEGIEFEGGSGSREEGLRQEEVVPAQGWVVNVKGEVTLVGYNPGNAADSRNPRPSSVCVPR
jgi:large exoprotein involved in heme utilization and adhesion